MYGRHYFKILVSMFTVTNNDPHCEEGIRFVETMLYDCVIYSWREAIYSPYLIHNVTVVDTHGIYGRGLMYWLLGLLRA